MINTIRKRTLREFGLMFSLLFPLFFGILIPNIYGHEYREWAFWVGSIFLILAIISPKILYLPYQLWMKLGFILGYINSKIIFGIIFYFVVTPIGILTRAFNYDPLNLKLSRRQKSYKEYTKEDKIDLTRIF